MCHSPLVSLFVSVSGALACVLARVAFVRPYALSLFEYHYSHLIRDIADSLDLRAVGQRVAHVEHDRSRG
jgi:hypothetical protein